MNMWRQIKERKKYQEKRKTSTQTKRKNIEIIEKAEKKRWPNLSNERKNKKLNKKKVKSRKKKKKNMRQNERKNRIDTKI